jgi:hypothetical protein
MLFARGVLLARRTNPCTGALAAECCASVGLRGGAPGDAGHSANQEAQ